MTGSGAGDDRGGATGASVRWVDCPICGEPDMRREPEGDEGGGIITCTNLACPSNGGSSGASRSRWSRFWRWLFDADTPLVCVKVTERRNPWT